MPDMFDIVHEDFDLGDGPPGYEEHIDFGLQLSHESMASLNGPDDRIFAEATPWQPRLTPTIDSRASFESAQQESMYTRALQAKEKAWGPDAPTTLQTVEILAKFYAEQGRTSEAEEMYLRLLRARGRTIHNTSEGGNS